MAWNKSEFAELTREMDNYQDNNDFKIVIKERSFDLKNTKNF